MTGDETSWWRDDYFPRELAASLTRRFGRTEKTSYDQTGHHSKTGKSLVTKRVDKGHITTVKSFKTDVSNTSPSSELIEGSRVVCLCARVCVFVSSDKSTAGCVAVKISDL